MGNPLETNIADGILQATGSDFFTGLLVLVFFLGITLMQGTRMEAKIAILVPAMLLAAAFIPLLRIIVALVGAALLWFAYTRMFQR